MEIIKHWYCVIAVSREFLHKYLGAPHIINIIGVSA